MRDGPGRRALKRVALWNFELGLRLTRAVRRWRGERAWTLGGECRRCAACCEAPAIQVGVFVWFVPVLRRLFLLWQASVNGFGLVGQDGPRRVFVFECTHFDRATRACDSYDSRPGMCRDYPRLLLYQANPDFLSGCGYRAAPPNAAGLRVALDKTPLSAEQRRELEKRLRLDG
jgi:Fe-S-cluster containining protein